MSENSSGGGAAVFPQAKMNDICLKCSLKFEADSEFCVSCNEDERNALISFTYDGESMPHCTDSAVQVGTDDSMVQTKNLKHGGNENSIDSSKESQQGNASPVFTGLETDNHPRISNVIYSRTSSLDDAGAIQDETSSSKRSSDDESSDSESSSNEPRDQVSNNDELGSDNDYTAMLNYHSIGFVVATEEESIQNGGACPSSNHYQDFGANKVHW